MCVYANTQMKLFSAHDIMKTKTGPNLASSVPSDLSSHPQHYAMTLIGCPPLCVVPNGKVQTSGVRVYISHRSFINGQLRCTFMFVLAFISSPHSKLRTETSCTPLLLFSYTNVAGFRMRLCSFLSIHVTSAACMTRFVLCFLPMSHWQ